MKNKDILTIVSLSCLGVSLITSMIKKVPDIVKNSFFFIAIVLLAVAQLFLGKVKEKIGLEDGETCPPPNYDSSACQAASGRTTGSQYNTYICDFWPFGCYNNKCGSSSGGIQNPDTKTGCKNIYKNSLLFSKKCKPECCLEQCSYCQNSCPGDPGCLKKCLQDSRGCTVSSGKGIEKDPYIIKTPYGDETSIKCNVFI